MGRFNRHKVQQWICRCERKENLADDGRALVVTWKCWSIEIACLSIQCSVCPHSKLDGKFSCSRACNVFIVLWNITMRRIYIYNIHWKIYVYYYWSIVKYIYCHITIMKKKKLLHALRVIDGFSQYSLVCVFTSETFWQDQ